MTAVVSAPFALHILIDVDTPIAQAGQHNGDGKGPHSAGAPRSSLPGAFGHSAITSEINRSTVAAMDLTRNPWCARVQITATGQWRRMFRMGEGGW